MDLSEFQPSMIQPTIDDLAKVEFPSFCGYVKLALYRNIGEQISYGIGELFPHFRAEDTSYNIGKIILASSFFGYIWLRIIDAKDIYKETLLLIEEGEIFSLELMGKSFFVLIYTEVGWERRVYTNIPEDGLFSWKHDRQKFIIVNSLTETVIFEKESPKVLRKKKVESGESNKDIKITIIKDPLSRENDTFLEKILARGEKEKIFSYDRLDDVFLLHFSEISEKDLKNFIGFIGIYCCILEESIIWLHDYLLESEVTDSDFHLPESFWETPNVSFFDPRWKKLRKWLLEISHLSYILSQSQKDIQSGIQELDNLGNINVLGQKKRLELTLENIRYAYSENTQRKNLLIELLRNKIS